MGDDKITVRRANVILQVNADDKDRYMAKGYDVIDGMGNIITQSVPTDVKILQKHFIDSAERIKSLEAELQHYKDKLRELENADNIENVDSVEPKKRTRKTKQD